MPRKKPEPKIDPKLRELSEKFKGRIRDDTGLIMDFHKDFHKDYSLLPEEPHDVVIGDRLCVEDRIYADPNLIDYEREVPKKVAITDWRLNAVLTSFSLLTGKRYYTLFGMGFESYVDPKIRFFAGVVGRIVILLALAFAFGMGLG